MKLLIKLGGALLDSVESRARIASEIAEVAREYETVVVHGGGKQLTRFLEAQGIQSNFVNGLRVSDAHVIDGVVKVLAGTVNKGLVSALIAAGGRPLGISGVDGLLTQAVQLAPGLQFVGKPISTDGHLIDLLVKSGYLPVVACLACDDSGAIYNVNADQMAVSCATGWAADKLLFLTDVPGVKIATGEVASHLTVAQMLELVCSGVAYGGMQAKLEAAVAALQSIGEVVIAPGDQPNICRRVLNRDNIGTRLSLKSEVPA